MNYKPFTNDNTKEIIKEIKDNLPNINKSIISIDTLDLCHLIGEIERLQNIIDKAVDYIEYMQNISENKNIYVSVYDLVKLLRREDKE